MTEDRIQKTEDRAQNTDSGLKVLLAGVAMLFAFCAVLTPGRASAELSIKANHDHMKIDFFYHGSTVGVAGLSDPGTDLVVKITSPEGHQALKKKGKMGGLLWMNVGELKFERTPGLYLLRSSKPLDQILSPEERTKHLLGYPALKDYVEISPVASDEERTEWFGEFVKFQESSSLYSVLENTVSLSEKEGKQDYSAHLDWPYQAAPGRYSVTVYAVRDKRVVETANTEILVEQVGSVRTLADMAKNKGALYGILSIIAALGAGFGVGMVFRKGGGSH